MKTLLGLIPISSKVINTGVQTYIHGPCSHKCDDLNDEDMRTSV